ncbi:MAG: hypothetical protein V1870_04355 [Candidatus Aenigmatarchaeota archaeon]
MPIIGFFNFPESTPPGRVYIHSDGLEEIYGSVDEVKRYFIESLHKNKYDIPKHQFFIGIAWGCNEMKIIDFMTYSDIDEWPGNPEVSIGSIINGLYQTEHVKLCGDGLILLGKEEHIRRQTRDLEEYKHLSDKTNKSIPDIGAFFK